MTETDDACEFVTARECQAMHGAVKRTLAILVTGLVVMVGTTCAATGIAWRSAADLTAHKAADDAHRLAVVDRLDDLREDLLRLEDKLDRFVEKHAARAATATTTAGTTRGP